MVMFNFNMPYLWFGWPFHVAPGFQFDYVFDWTILKYQQSQIAAPPARAVVSGGVLLVNIRCLAVGIRLSN